MDKRQPPRFWELDILRAAAVFMMIFYHILYDLEYFGEHDFGLDSLPWVIYARIGASIFIVLVGISLTLSFSRAEVKGIPEKGIQLKQVKRGAMIFGWGLIITFITWYILDEFVIVFGILHLIGLSILLGLTFVKYRLLNVVLGMVIIIIGAILIYPNFEFPWLVWLGFRPMEYNYVDYFPLLPWFGVVLIGIAAGHVLYPKYERIFSLPDLSENMIIKPLTFIGRHSLFIYLVHQPILFTVLYMAGLISF
jgi:uncharacterized membrane protein